MKLIAKSLGDPGHGNKEFSRGGLYFLLSTALASRTKYSPRGAVGPCAATWVRRSWPSKRPGATERSRVRSTDSKLSSVRCTGVPASSF